MDILFRYIHFLSFILLCGSLLAENILIRNSMTRRELGTLARVDGLFGLSAMTALGAGLLLWFVYGKGFAFYARNPVFHAKLTLFLIVGLLSIRPTVFFLKQRKGNPSDTVPVPSARPESGPHRIVRGVGNPVVCGNDGQRYRAALKSGAG